MFSKKTILAGKIAITGVTALGVIFAGAVSASASSKSQNISFQEYRSGVDYERAALEGRASETARSMVVEYVNTSSTRVVKFTQQSSSTGAFRVKTSVVNKNEPGMGWSELICMDKAGKDCWRRSNSDPKWQKYVINVTYPYSLRQIVELGMFFPKSSSAKYRKAGTSYFYSDKTVKESSTITFTKSSASVMSTANGIRTIASVKFSKKEITIKPPV